MFGVVPKALWGKLVETDSLNRITLACNLLLIETPSGRVLVETGMGNRWSQAEIDRFGLQSLICHEAALSSLNLNNEDIDAVVFSHLHFDHAGGAVISVNGNLLPAFPRARHYVQRGEWEFAHTSNQRGKASYRLDDFEPIQKHGLFEFLDGEAEILPGVRVHKSGGHTSHHQIVTWESAGLKGVFFADIMPTCNHLQPSWVMGYDNFPLSCCDTKSEWLSLASKEKWLVVLDHETGVAWGHVNRLESGKYQWQPLPEG